MLLTRPIAGRWSVEARYQYWTDALLASGSGFRRQLAYAGLVWGQPR